MHQTHEETQRKLFLTTIIPYWIIRQTWDDCPQDNNASSQLIGVLRNFLFAFVYLRSTPPHCLNSGAQMTDFNLFLAQDVIGGYIKQCVPRLQDMPIYSIQYFQSPGCVVIALLL